MCVFVTINRAKFPISVVDYHVGKCQLTAITRLLNVYQKKDVYIFNDLIEIVLMPARW